MISHTFTFGAPHVSNPMLTNRHGGCFDGFRISCFYDDDWWKVDTEDLVPLLLVLSTYNHPNIQTLGIKNQGNGYHLKFECGKNPFRPTDVFDTTLSLSLHSWEKSYLPAMRRLKGSSYTRAKEASAVGLAYSYVDNLGTVKKGVNAQGWNLVGSSTIGEDITHLMQEPISKRCILTFEGSDSVDDFKADAAVKSVHFCGLPMKVHLGFRDELLRMVEGASFQTHIRSKLGKCSSVDSVGHSLGGAVAMLFTACVDWQNGSDDYKKMSWTVEKPELLSPL